MKRKRGEAGGELLAVHHGAALQRVDPQLGLVAGGPQPGHAHAVVRHVGQAGGEVGEAGQQLRQRRVEQQRHLLQWRDHVHLQQGKVSAASPLPPCEALCQWTID